jgi:hypothetical protein
MTKRETYLAEQDVIEAARELAEACKHMDPLPKDLALGKVFLAVEALEAAEGE